MTHIGLTRSLRSLRSAELVSCSGHRALRRIIGGDPPKPGNLRADHFLASFARWAAIQRGAFGAFEAGGGACGVSG
jgi:hypothetical protein